MEAIKKGGVCQPALKSVKGMFTEGKE